MKEGEVWIWEEAGEWKWVWPELIVWNPYEPLIHSEENLTSFRLSYCIHLLICMWEWRVVKRLKVARWQGGKVTAALPAPSLFLFRAHWIGPLWESSWRLSQRKSNTEFELPFALLSYCQWRWGLPPTNSYRQDNHYINITFQQEKNCVTVLNSKDEQFAANNSCITHLLYDRSTSVLLNTSVVSSR